MFCAIVPPHLLARLARIDDPRHAAAASAARHALVQLDPLLAARSAALAAPVRRGATIKAGLHRRISDAGNLEALPGTLVRAEGAGPTGDSAVDEAYDGLGATHALFSEVYGRGSIDDGGRPLDATVHFGDKYDNAFWDGERMVFGDGDGDVFGSFTRSLTVISHELAHCFTQYTTNLIYQGQSGALNESLSDVFGVLVEQYLLRQDAADAAWLVGAGVFTEEVQGEALRSLAAPGTAYDDDVLGKDPQPAVMADYVDTAEDDGGVHINSGIPNHAFYLAARQLGGFAWERAGQIWYDAAVGGNIPADCDFVGFAAATEQAAAERYGASSEEANAVADAWSKVGVAP